MPQREARLQLAVEDAAVRGVVQSGGRRGEDLHRHRLPEVESAVHDGRRAAAELPPPPALVELEVKGVVVEEPRRTRVLLAERRVGHCAGFGRAIAHRRRGGRHRVPRRGEGAAAGESFLDRRGDLRRQRRGDRLRQGLDLRRCVLLLLHDRLQGRARIGFERDRQVDLALRQAAVQLVEARAHGGPLQEQEDLAFGRLLLH
mmetsp:Transcript_46364/g.143062  ORF Transcript_46364/g.143062 Transcript_46364/m.143062 type:complete len:202 (-) Transcript_46364:450-1055(-)